jgi:hypothetical protein
MKIINSIIELRTIETEARAIKTIQYMKYIMKIAVTFVDFGI